MGWTSDGWTEAKAAHKLAEIKAAIRTGVGYQSLREKREAVKAEREAKERERITFNAVVESHWEEASRSKSPRTMLSERAHLERVAPIIGEKPLKSIAVFDLERIKKNMADAGRKPRTITYALAVVRQVFNFAARHGLFQGENPVSKVKMPFPPESIPSICS